MKRLVRALLVLATSTLVVCGVKGPPRPAVQESADAGQGDGPQEPSRDGGEP
jgi:predicted small lipoprotein YifL